MLGAVAAAHVYVLELAEEESSEIEMMHGIFKEPVADPEPVGERPHRPRERPHRQMAELRFRRELLREAVGAGETLHVPDDDRHAGLRGCRCEVGGFVVAGLTVLACRVDDQLYAYRDNCPACEMSLAGAALHRAMGDRLREAQNRVALLCGRLDALSPLRVMGRGYAAVETINRKKRALLACRFDKTAEGREMYKISHRRTPSPSPSGWNRLM